MGVEGGGLEFKIFFTKNPNRNFLGGMGRWSAGVSDFFTKNPNLK